MSAAGRLLEVLRQKREIVAELMRRASKEIASAVERKEFPSDEALAAYHKAAADYAGIDRAIGVARRELAREEKAIGDECGRSGVTR